MGLTMMNGLLGNFRKLPGLLGQAVGGLDDPRLSPLENLKARRQAMLMGGLQTLAANGQGVGGLAAIAQGAMAGQQIGAQAREQAYGRTAEERITQALNDPAVMGKLTAEQKAMIRLLPPMQAVEMLSKLAFAPAPEAKVVGSGGTLVGADGTELYRNTAQPDLPADLRAALWEMGVDAATLTPEQRTAAVARYEELKRSGATNVNVGGQQEFGNLNALATQFRQDAGEYQDVANAYATVQAAVTSPSPAGDIALIFAFMKMQDPGSTVREGEQATARNAGNIPERIRAQYNRLLGTGESLTDVQRADFVGQARRTAEARQRQFKPILSRYRARAQEAGLNPSLVIYDPFAEVGLVEPAEGAPTWGSKP